MLSLWLLTYKAENSKTGDFLFPDDPANLKMSLTSKTDGDSFFGQDSSATIGFTVNQTLLLIVMILAIIIINFIVVSIFLYR